MAQFLEKTSILNKFCDVTLIKTLKLLMIYKNLSLLYFVERVNDKAFDYTVFVLFSEQKLSKISYFVTCFLEIIYFAKLLESVLQWVTLNPSKLLSAIFYQICISHQLIALQKLCKRFFMSSKKLFSFSRYSFFCISVFSSFSPCQPLLQRWIDYKSY